MLGVSTMDKTALLEQLRADLREALAVMVRAAKSAKEAATHEEMKPENDKDTRGLEAGYLAGAQAQRAAELSQAVRGLEELSPRDFAPDEPIAALAWVELIDLDSAVHSHVFVSPYGGGRKMRFAGVEVQIATARSPLGDALIGRRAGDIVELQIAGNVRELEIVSVR